MEFKGEVFRMELVGEVCSKEFEGKIRSVDGRVIVTVRNLRIKITKRIQG